MKNHIFCSVKTAAVALCAMLPSLAFAADREQLTNIPTVYIDTENSAAITSKSEYVPGTLTVLSDDADECCEALPMGIRGRGNSTWNMAKKPYRVKFESKTKFMNLPAKAKSWVFLANYADKTLLRNAVAFEISRTVELEYSAPVKFVDVVLNGKYIGNYLVTDQMEVAKGRVPVETQEITDVAEPEVTGGYLLEVDGFADSEPVWFQTPKGVKVTIKYPKDDEINAEQRKYITDYYYEFEKRMFSADYADPELGYRSMVDSASLVNWYIACELTGNSDCFWSTYMYKKREDPALYFGPMWDYDIAFNNDNRLGNATYSLMRDVAHNPRTWINQLWKDAWFRTAVNRRWTQLVEEGIEQHLLDTVDAYAALIDASQQKNYAKWGKLSDRVYLETYLFPTYQGGVDYLKDYLSDRIAFLTDSFESTDPSRFVQEIDVTKTYKIQHSSGAYMGEGNDKWVLVDKDAAPIITFVPVDSDGSYGILSENEHYFGSDNKWNSQFHTDLESVYSHFLVEKEDEPGYVRLKNLGTKGYLGVDRTMVSSSIYTNKAADSAMGLWRLEEQKIQGVADAASDECVRRGDTYYFGKNTVSVQLYTMAGACVGNYAGNTLNVGGVSHGAYVVLAIDRNGLRRVIKLII